MSQPEATLSESPVDFESAVAYALHPEMRRLILLYIVGALLLPIGLSTFLGPNHFPMVQLILFKGIGLIIALIGATLLFGGLIGAIFKLVTDANLLAMNQ